MRLPFMRPKDPATPRARPAAVPAGDDALVQAARTRARQRLVGALVLLAVGVIGFPVLFDTQPRPMAPDMPIEVVRPDGSAAPRAVQVPPAKAMPLNLPPADAGVESAPGTLTVGASAASSPQVLAAQAGTQAAVQAAAQSAVAPVVVAPPPRLASSAVAQRAVASAPAARPASSAAQMPAARPASAAAPRAAGSAAAPPPAAASAAGSPGRYVVQAGAYNDATKLRDARQKVERLGLKTYTQVIDSEAGKRTRVRVGPFATRQEADAVAAKVKAAGLQANVLTL